MSHVAKAASVLLARQRASAEVFVVQRAQKLRFMGGFCAFPGGKVSASDPAVSVECDSLGADQELCRQGRFVAAARELFEESGVLIARRPDGTFPKAGAALDYLRRKSLSDEMDFGRILERLGVRIHARDFQAIGGVTTPPFVPVRFDTTFFLARMPEGQSAKVWPGELDHGEWMTAEEALSHWARGEILISPPTVLILQAIRGRPVEEFPSAVAELLRSQSQASIHSIYFAPGVQMIPVYTQALPPSTHTNAYLVGGDETAYLIDPGTAEPQEQERLFSCIDARLATGGALKAVVLTHHHPDHIGAANASAKRYNVPIWSHPLTAQRLQGKVPVSGEILPADRLDLGSAPDGSRPWFLEAVHTPGHAPGHLVFWEPHYRLLIAGDLVSTLSSIVIAPPDGDLTVYLDTLKRMLDYDCRLLLPAHGSASSRPKDVIRESIAHRHKRERQLLAALRARPRTIKQLATDLYKGIAPKMMRFAELQVQAGLDKLQREGRVQCNSNEDGETWSVKWTT